MVVPLWCRAALKQPLDLYNIREIDASLGKTLETIYASHQAWLKSESAQPMVVDGVRIEDLCLTFELPGDSFALLSSLLWSTFRSATKVRTFGEGDP